MMVEAAWLAGAWRCLFKKRRLSAIRIVAVQKSFGLAGARLMSRLRKSLVGEGQNAKCLSGCCYEMTASYRILVI